MYQRRSLPYPMSDTLDHPDMNVTSGARNVSTVPTQALTLLNNPFVLSEAAFLAERVSQQASDPQSQVSWRITWPLRWPATGTEIADRDRLIRKVARVAHPRRAEPRRILYEVRACRIAAAGTSGTGANFFRSGGGIAGSRFAYLLDRQGLLSAESAAPPAGDACEAAAVGVNLTRPRPAFQTARDGRDLLFHGRRLEPGGYFRSEARAREYAGEPIDDKVQGDGRAAGFPGPLMPSPFSFKKYGQSGIEVSEIFPHLSRHVDEVAFLRSVHGRRTTTCRARQKCRWARSTLVFRVSARGSHTVLVRWLRACPPTS